MKCKVLKTESEYTKAIQRIEELFDSAPGSTLFDELELLVLLVKDYEDKYYPMPAPDPVEVIKLKMTELGMKNKDLISIIGSEGHVSSVLSRRRKITLDMARSISKLLHILFDIFINENVGPDHYLAEDKNNMKNYLNAQLEISKERILRLHTLNAIMEKSSAEPAPYALSRTIHQLYEAVVDYHKPASADDQTIDPAKK